MGTVAATPPPVAGKAQRLGTRGPSQRRRQFGISTVPSAIALGTEAKESLTALDLASQRLYAKEGSGHRSHTPDQVRDLLMGLIAERQSDLSDHLHEVAAMTRSVARNVGLEGRDLRIVVRAAELHDVGKIAVPGAILNKSGPLDPYERAIIESHCEAGERILAAAPAMGPVARLVRASHERHDGRGYPDRRSGSEIPLGASIIAVCDAFHAMTSDLPYSTAIDARQAILELRREAGTQFAPDVVEVFCAVFAAGQLG